MSVTTQVWFFPQLGELNIKVEGWLGYSFPQTFEGKWEK